MSNGKSATPRATATTRNREGSSATTKRSAANAAAASATASTTSRRRSASAKPTAHRLSNPGAPERHAMVAYAAYFRAEARGFAPGRELDDWVAAEAEIDTLIGQGA